VVVFRRQYISAMVAAPIAAAMVRLLIAIAAVVMFGVVVPFGLELRDEAID
jgi:hypothetical protein